MALLSVRGEGLRKGMPCSLNTHMRSNTAKFPRGAADDARVCVGEAIGDVRSEEVRTPVARRGRSYHRGVEPGCAPVDDTTDAAAVPEDVARVEVAVSEDALGTYVKADVL